MSKKNADKNTLPYDYSGHEDTGPAADSKDALARISVLADSMHQLDKDIAEAELKVKKLKARHEQIAEEQLPELFREVGMKELTTLTGLPLKLKNKVHTNISKGRKPKAIAWLDEHGQGGMVKRSVIIDFDKTQQDKVDALFRLIGKGWPNHRAELDVHASTVKAFVKKRLENGETIDHEIFGIHCVDVVEISSSKK
jgi:hypothetical protein